MNKYSVVCPVCSSAVYLEYLNAQDLNQAKSDSSFQYYRCVECATIFLYPVPEDLGKYYDNNYPAYRKSNSSKIEIKHNLLEKDKLEIIEKYARGRRLVEIGPASGRFLSVAHMSGFDVVGVEQDIECVNYINDALGIKVLHSNIPSEALFRLGKESAYDVVVAWHVIEHLSDLQEFIISASSALSDRGGILVVSTPNPESWSFKIFKRYWVHLDAPRHLSLIPVDALDCAMMKHGFNRIGCVMNDKVGLELNRMGWQCSLINLGSKKLTRIFLGKVGRVVSFIMHWLDRVPSRGAAYTAIYRKDHHGQY